MWTLPCTHTLNTNIATIERLPNEQRCVNGWCSHFFFESVLVTTVRQEMIFSGLCVHGHLSTALTAPRAFWLILETWTHGFLLIEVWTCKNKSRHRSSPQARRRTQCSCWSGGGVKNKTQALCQERKETPQRIKLQPDPAASPHCFPQPFIFHSLILLLLCQLILLPHFYTPHPASILPVSLCLCLSEQTGRDRETVVVLAVWHYQLINPCQQLVRLLSYTQPSLHWFRRGGTHWPARKGLTADSTKMHK